MIFGENALLVLQQKRQADDPVSTMQKRLVSALKSGPSVPVHHVISSLCHLMRGFLTRPNLDDPVPKILGGLYGIDSLNASIVFWEKRLFDV